MTGPNGETVPREPVLVGETCIVLHVLHFDTGVASSSFHVTAAGRGHLLNRPKMLAEMLRGHAAELEARPGLILPPEHR